MTLTPRLRLIFFSAALILTALPARADNLGRLFYQPQERAALDAQRSQSAAPGQVSETVTVNGLVTRSSGKSTVWINGVPQQEGEGGAVEVLHRQGAGGKVTLRHPGKDKAVDLRVGQTLESGNGKVREVYEPAPADKNTGETAP